MTIDEASRRYNIPLGILKEYERWGLCGEVKKVMGAWQYDEEDIRRLSMIMTLHDIGFDNTEIGTYMRLMLAGRNTDEERTRMIQLKRDETLDEIHFKQKCLDRLDYLKFKIRQAENAE